MLKPLADKIIIKPSKPAEVTKGGIVLPDSAKEKPREGKVLSVGPGRLSESGKRVPPEVKKGDIVVYSEYGGTELNIGGEQFVVLDEHSVLAVKESKK